MVLSFVILGCITIMFVFQCVLAVKISNLTRLLTRPLTVKAPLPRNQGAYRTPETPKLPDALDQAMAQLVRDPLADEEDELIRSLRTLNKRLENNSVDPMSHGLAVERLSGRLDVLRALKKTS